MCGFVSPKFVLVTDLSRQIFFVATREFVSLSFVLLPSLSFFVVTREFVSPNFVVTSLSC